MKKYNLIPRLIITLTAIVLITGTASAQYELILDKLAWLAGIWHQEESENPTYEMWKRVSEKTFEGIAYNLIQKKEKDKEVELLRIVEMGGELFYIDKPPKKELPTCFKLIKIDDKKAVFENTANLFPQKIVYQLTAPDKMQVTLSSVDSNSGLETKLEVKFRRVG